MEDTTANQIKKETEYTQTHSHFLPEMSFQYTYLHANKVTLSRSQ